jgi:hypothetical protein
VLDEAFLKTGRVDLPQFLDADAELLEVGSFVEVEVGNGLLAERTARAFGKKCIGCAQFHAAHEIGARNAVAVDTHVARGHAHDLAVFKQQFRSGKSGEDLDAELFGAGRQKRVTLPSEPMKLPWLSSNFGIIAAGRPWEPVWVR